MVQFFRTLIAYVFIGPLLGVVKLIFLLFSAVFLCIMLDAANVYSVYNSGYKTPWFNSNPVLSPTVNTLSIFCKTRMYWAKNGAGTEDWQIKEVMVGDVTFWTIVQRVTVTK